MLVEVWVLRIRASRLDGGWELRVTRSPGGLLLVVVLLLPLVLGTAFTASSVVFEPEAYWIAVAIQPTMILAILWFFLRQPVGTIRVDADQLAVDVSRLRVAIPLHAIEEVVQGPGYLTLLTHEGLHRVTDGWPGDARRWLRDTLREGRITTDPPGTS